MLPMLEADIQRAFFDWVEFRAISDDRFNAIFPVPNNAQPGTRMMGMLKKLGMRAGVHDVIGLIPTAKFHGFTIEFKSKSGTASEKQIKFAQLVRKLGYAPMLCNDVELAKKSVNKWLEENTRYQIQGSRKDVKKE